MAVQANDRDIVLQRELELNNNKLTATKAIKQRTQNPFKQINTRIPTARNASGVVFNAFTFNSMCFDTFSRCRYTLNAYLCALVCVCVCMLCCHCSCFADVTNKSLLLSACIRTYTHTGLRMHYFATGLKLV